MAEGSQGRRAVWTALLAIFATYLFVEWGARYALYTTSLDRSYVVTKEYYEVEGGFWEFKERYESAQDATLLYSHPLVVDAYQRKFYLPGVTGHTLGFQQPAPMPKPAPDQTRILCLGSSTVERGFPAPLRALLENDGRFEVINAGIPGASLQNLFMNYALLWRSLEADIVIIEYNTDAVPRNPFRPFALSEGIALDEDVVADALDQEHLAFGRGLADLFRGPARFRIADTTRIDEPRPDGLARYRAFLENLVLLVRASGAVPVLVTYQPAFQGDELRGQFSPERHRDFLTFYQAMFVGHTLHGAARTFTAHNQIMRAVATEQDAILVEAAHVLPLRDEYFRDATHHSDLANEIVAKVILSALREHGLVDRQR